MRIVKNGITLKTLNFTCRVAARSPDLRDESLVSTQRCGWKTTGSLIRFLNYFGFHGNPHSTGHYKPFAAPTERWLIGRQEKPHARRTG
jgi:hypothetical protein